jgi:hypothetical protein
MKNVSGYIDELNLTSANPNPGIYDLNIMPSYYQGENMTVSFSIKNPGSIGINATPSEDAVIITQGIAGSLKVPHVRLPRMHMAR